MDSPMTGLDRFIGGHAAGQGAAVVLALAFALGLRHASDPDHLVAVSTLVADTRGRAARVAARLGAAWGLGHATTLLAFGLPVLLVRAFLPHVVEQSAESLIGAIIVLLALRLLRRWRRGAYHVHLHAHDGRRHLHLHSHAGTDGHAHAHPARTPRQAFSVVLVTGCALSMTAMSALVGGALHAAAARRRLLRAIPALGGAALAFGVWYLASALAAV